MKRLKPLFVTYLALVLLAAAIALAAAASSPASAEPPAPHLQDENLLLDFETNTTEGWERSTKPGERGILAVYPTSTQAYHGLYSLALAAHLDDSDPDLRQGLTFVMVPGDVEGRPISAWIRCPAEAGGDPSHPNGVQLFVRDQEFRSQLAPWLNLGEDIPPDVWTEIQFTPSYTGTPGGVTDPGFDPTRITIAGLKLGAGTGSQVPFQGTCYLDYVGLSRASLVVPDSDHTFDFDDLTPEQQRDKPLGYGPYWDADPGWGAGAWDSGDVTVENGALAITATFTLSEPYTSQKGYIGVLHLPSLDVNNKTDRVIRAEARFEPYVGPERMLASIWVYDRRDAGPDHKWFGSRDVWVGGSVWNELVFDLGNPSHFFTDTNQCPNCLLPSDLVTDSLKNVLKVGIQFFANEPYSGTLYLDNVTLGGTEILTSFHNLNEGFVTAEGGEFSLDGQPYRFAGTNVYYPFFKSHYMIDDVMETMQRNGLAVVRTWGFGDGKAPYADDGDGLANGNEGGAFQPEMGLYYEPTFVNFDYVLRSAGAHGVRLVVPLVNYWSDVDVEDEGERQNAFGGMGQYLEWCGIEPQYDDDGRLANKSVFYTDTCTVQAYKAYAGAVVNRVNTLTGVAYKDDPTILAWELANEPRCERSTACAGGDVVYSWTAEMSAYLQALDPNHLVALGDEGFLSEAEHPDPFYNGWYGVDWERNLGLAGLDFATVHLYPDAWQRDLPWAATWITHHVGLAQGAGKPVVFEEFGICYDSGDNPFLGEACDNLFDRDSTYAAWADLFEAGAQGDAVWMIAGQVNSADEDHVLIGGKYYYPDYDGYTFWEPSTTMAIIREHAARMRSDTWDVCPEGCPYDSVQAAIDAADPGGRIRVGQGTYAETIVVTKTVRLEGGYYGPPDWLRDISLYETILDGAGSGPVVQVTGGYSPTLEGLTITGGQAQNGGGVYISGASPTLSATTACSNSAQYGGGIYVTAHASPTLTRNTIISNTASSRGGGLYISNDSSPTVADNAITGNKSSGRAGGIAINNALPALARNEISHNEAAGFGGGIYTIGGTATPRLDGNWIMRNTASHGAGVFIDDYSKPTFVNNVIARNHGISYGGGFYIDYYSEPAIINNSIVANNLGPHWANDGIYMYGNVVSVTIINNIIVAHSYGIRGPTGLSGTIDYNLVWDCLHDCYAGVDPGPHDISEEPRFADPENDDYHLLCNSPAIDAGTSDGAPPTDFDGDPRPLGDGVDMGADEAIPTHADFTAWPTTGEVPLTVVFTDTSIGPVEQWYWDLGDGATSELQHPTHEYTQTGSFTVTLTITGPYCTDTLTRPNLITVTQPTIHVQAIVLRYWDLGAQKLVRAVVRIVDEDNLPVGGALVTGKWTLPNGMVITREATTYPAGWALFWIRTPLTGVYQFCVTDVVKEGYAYDPNQNVETCDEMDVP